MCLSGSGYSTAASQWFGQLETDFSAAGGVSGSSADPQSQFISTRQYLVRLTADATEAAGSLAGVQPLIASSSVDLQVSSGLGLAGQIPPKLVLPLCLAFFALQMVASHYWLARWRFGPLEWLWRTLTYGERPAMRKVPA